MNATQRRAAKCAESLSVEAQLYLTEDYITNRGRNALKRAGVIDADGRLTAFGVLVTRHLMQSVKWTEADSIAVTVEAVTSSGARMVLAGAERREAIRTMARRGFSAREIAARIGGSPEAASALARSMGCPITGVKPGTVIITEKDKKKILGCERGRGRVWVEMW